MSAKSLAKEKPTFLNGWQLVVARVAWIIVAVLSAWLFIIAFPDRFDKIINAPTEISRARLELGLSNFFVAVYYSIFEVAIALFFYVAAVTLFFLKPADWLTIFASAMLVMSGIALPPVLYELETHPLWRVPAALVRAFGFGFSIIFFYVFPDGKFAPRWTRALTVVLVAWLLSGTFFPDTLIHPKTWPPHIWVLGVLCWFSSGVFAQLYRYRHVSTLLQRQQTKWVISGFMVGLLNFGLLFFILVAPSLRQPGPQQEAYVLVIYPLYYFAFPSLIPLTISISILRYRLWDIDIIINRALVYSLLTAGIAGLYVIVVVGLGALFQTSGNLLISLLATAFVAILFQPLRDRLQRAVNRLMYGERDEPYVVLSRLGQRLESTLAPRDVLPTIVETITQTLKLPYAAVRLSDGQEQGPAGEYGAPPSNAKLVSFPLVYQGETVGLLEVAPRAPDEPFTSAELQLLADIAHQAGLATHNVRLTADLQRSREHLVTAREEERRRLRRDLHDGLGPTLASQTLKLDAALDLLKSDPDAAAKLLADLKAQSQSTVADIRRVIYELRPPALDELGVVAALRAHVGQYNPLNGLRIQIESPPEGLPPLSAAVEVAAYHIAVEALANVVRHAQARECCIRFSLADPARGGRPYLHLEIADDGIGLPDERRAGVGLFSMRERAEELGGACVVERRVEGGTRVAAQLPLTM